MKTTTYPERVKQHPALSAPGAKPTGRYWISPCCTASLYEWRHEGHTFIVGSVSGHGYTCHAGTFEEYRPEGPVLRTTPACAEHYELHRTGCGCPFDH